jgi:hypothetical protein
MITTAVLKVRKVDWRGLSMSWLRMATYIAGMMMISSPFHPYAFVSRRITQVAAAIMTTTISRGSTRSMDWIIAAIPATAMIFTGITEGYL